MTYFQNPKTLEELKRQYKTLAMKYHPDMGGSTEAMQAVNAEYDKLFTLLKKVAENGSEGFTSESKAFENEGAFKDIIEQIIHFSGIDIEIIGTWIWVTGNTFQYKDKLKELKFQWVKTKTAWCWHEGEYQKHYKKQYSLDDIRKMWGSEKVGNKPNTVLQA